MDTPAFALDFDPLAPLLLLNESSSLDHAEFDKVLGELDLELASDTTSHVVHSMAKLGEQSGPSATAAGLRELFGAQQGWGMPQQAPQLVADMQLAQQQQQQLDMQQQALLQQQQQQLLLLQQQQQQQQLLLKQEQQQQQQQQQLPVVYQLPSPFVQPMAALAPGLPWHAGLAGMYAGMQPTQLLDQMQMAQQQQLQLQQHLLANGVQQQQSPSAPMYTFHALPGQQPAASGAAAAPAGTTGPDGSPAALSLLSMPQYAATAQGSGSSGSLSPAVWAAAAAGMSPSGAMFNNAAAAHSVLGGDGMAGAAAAAAAPATQRRGRGRGNGGAASAPGAEKPKAPSQRFRERQKATISSLEAEVTAKLAELQVLSQENEMLKLRSAVLEAVTSGREYHMRVIKEHGPPSFDVAGSTPAQLSAGGATSLRGGNGGSSGSEQQQNSATASGDSPRSGSFNSSTTGSAATGLAAAAAGGAGAAAAGATSGEAAMATDEASPSDAADAAAADDDVAAVADDPLVCGTEGACTLDQNRSSIRCIRQMKASDIIMHWRQFLQDVSEELLMSDDKDEQERLERGELGLSASSMGRASDCSGSARSSKTHAAQPQQQQQPDDTSDDSNNPLGLSKVCRWCGCTNTEGLHLPGGCTPTDTQQQEPQQQQAAAAAAGGGGGEPAADATDARLIELVNKYSYMTKFVALLNPGVLYSLLGRNLDTGEAAAYTDEHWRGVVNRLHLTKQQTTYITACAELYFSSLCGLMHERSALHAALVQAEGGLSECQRRLLGVDGTLDQLTVLERLSSNLKKEHVLRIMLNCFCWGRVLTAVQFAKTAVYSHPFFPDVHALVCVIYEDEFKTSPGCSQAGKVFPHRIAAAKAALCQAPALPRTTAAAQAAQAAAAAAAAEGAAASMAMAS